MAENVDISGEARGDVDLPFGDINLLVVTDVHSWVAGHGRFEPNGNNADYGHVLSFYQRLKEYLATRRERDLFFFMNGDFMDGTGLSTIPPYKLTPILQQMPWDAVNLGNHELYHNETIEYITRPGGFVDHWKGNYLTSNTYFYPPHDNTASHQSELQPIGSRFTYLIGKFSGARILTFGFLFNFQNNCAITMVEKVEDTIHQEWFQKELIKGDFDAIIVLAHMDCVHRLVYLLLDEIRAIVGNDVPVQFLTGHTHRRAFSFLNESGTEETNAASLEAGHFLDTIGFASFSLPKPDSTTTTTSKFQHKFIDANKEVLRKVLNVPVLMTEEGLRLSQLINVTRENMHLNNVVGTVPSTFYRSKGLNETDSLWRLYMGQVIPQIVTKHNDSLVYVESTGGLRFDLLEGERSQDDLLAVSPYNDSIFTLCTSLSGKTIQDTLDMLNTLDRNIPSLPLFASTSVSSDASDDSIIPGENFLVKEKLYDVLGNGYDANLWFIALTEATSTNTAQRQCKPVPFCNYDTNTCWNSGNVWTRFVEGWIPGKSENETQFQSIVSSSKSQEFSIWKLCTPILDFGILIAIIGVVLTILSRRHRKYRSMDNIEENTLLISDNFSAMHSKIKPKGYGTSAEVLAIEGADTHLTQRTDNT